MKMKKKSGATAKKSASKKKAAAKPAPAAKSAPAKKAAPKRPTGRSESSEGGGREPYTPPPVEGIGWAPFRYPPR